MPASCSHEGAPNGDAHLACRSGLLRPLPPISLENLDVSGIPWLLFCGVGRLPERDHQGLVGLLILSLTRGRTPWRLVGKRKGEHTGQ